MFSIPVNYRDHAGPTLDALKGRVTGHCLQKLSVSLCVLCASAFVCFAQTPVLFPLNQMFGGAAYNKSFTLQAAQNWITDGTNAYIGSNITITPTGNTNPIVYLTPNTYLVQFPDATYPWRIAVPNATTLQSAVNLSTGPLPTFLTQPYVPLIAGPGVTVTNICECHDTVPLWFQNFT